MEIPFKITITIPVTVVIVEWMWHSEDRAASWYVPTIKANQMHCFSTLFW
jgi:hypothetical protein